MRVKSFIKNTKFIPDSNNKGQLLIEILIVIAIAVVIISAAAQLVYVSLRSNKFSEEMNVALGLMEETFSAVDGAATEQWQNVYNLNKGTSTSYFPQNSNGKWLMATGTENVLISGLTYSRSFTIQNACRDTDPAIRTITGITDSGGSAITCVASGGSYDPSTQRIAATISWPEADPVIFNKYFTRWRNKICIQSDWSGGSSGSTSTCPTNFYSNSPSPLNIDATSITGSIKLTP